MTGPTDMPRQLFVYLSIPELRPVWAAIHARLERNGLQATGTISVDLDRAAADQLSGLLSRRLEPGVARRIRLADLDAALRQSSYGRGLVSVLEIISGPLIDRRATRQEKQARLADVWQSLDVALAAAGLADAAWVPDWIEGLRRSGIVTRAGPDAAARALAHAVRALEWLLPRAGEPGSTRELAALATQVTGDAHGFDDTSLAAVVLLRAAAPAVGRPPPESAAERRDLWLSLGVATDSVSGTVLVWNLRPPGDDAWSRMMRDRADLGVVTHLTLHELDRAGPVVLSEPGRVLSVCENPQVLQAAANAGVTMPLICLSGNPAAAGTRLLQSVIGSEYEVRYHGDFDWPGTAIAGRIIALGAKPWRLSAADYRSAAARLDADHAVALTGNPVPTPWDPALAAVMSARGLAVHEEFVLDDLLTDLHGPLRRT